jgi:hypothetical protein
MITILILDSGDFVKGSPSLETARNQQAVELADLVIYANSGGQPRPIKDRHAAFRRCYTDDFTRDGKVTRRELNLHMELNQPKEGATDAEVKGHDAEAVD